MKVYIMAYKTMYNKNVCCNYILSYIMTINIFVIHESVYHVIRYDVFLLCKTMYNKNICCHYIRECIMTKIFYYT